MRDRIRPNDIVLHKPSGEKWVVAGVNYDEGGLIPKGYPFPSLAKIEDCELLEERYEFERQSDEVIKYFRDHGLAGYIDVRSAIFTGFIWPEARKMASDLISRKAVVAAICAERDKILDVKPSKHGQAMRGGMRKALHCVETAPAVDTVEVVRCKDCAYVDVPRCCPCQFSGFKVTNDWYCPMGVKKDAVD